MKHFAAETTDTVDRESGSVVQALSACCGVLGQDTESQIALMTVPTVCEPVCVPDEQVDTLHRSPYHLCKVCVCVNTDLMSL